MGLNIEAIIVVAGAVATSMINSALLALLLVRMDDLTKIMVRLDEHLREHTPSRGH